jgi:hypothetical protein
VSGSQGGCDPRGYRPVELLPLFIGAGSLSFSFLGFMNTGNQIISYYLRQKHQGPMVSIYSFLESFWFTFAVNSDHLPANNGNVCVCVYSPIKRQ